MALSRKDKLKLLKRSSQERAKKHASSGENFSYLDQEKLKELGLGIVRPKAREDNYFFNIIPYIDSNEEDAYVLVTKTHYINGKSVICPKGMFGLPCPICEKRMEKMASDPDDKDAIDALKVKEREVYYVQDVSNKTEKAKGIQIFEVSAFFFGWKIKPLTKPKVGGEGVKGNKGYIDISDFENGRTVSFNVSQKKAEFNGKMSPIPDYSGHTLEERDPISEEIIEKAVELPPLEDLIIKHTYDELYEMLNNEPNEAKGEEESSSRKTDDSDKKSDLKKRLEKIKKEKEKSIDLDFDFKSADLDELQDYILDNDVDIDDEFMGNEKKMRLIIKRFIAAKKEETASNNKSWPSRDDIDDIDDFLEEHTFDELKDFCKFHKIEYIAEDKVEIMEEIEEWYTAD